MATSPTTTPRVAVIGAGLAGIAAAVTLAEAGVPVILLEKTSRLGGRAGSTLLQNGTAQPIGSHLFLGCCSAYLQLLETIGTRQATNLQPRLRLAVVSNGRKAHLAASSLPYPLPLAPSFICYPFLSLTAKARILRGITAILSGTRSQKNETFAEWLRRHGQSLSTRRFFWELITAATLNAPAEEAAADLALLVFRAAVLGRGQAAAIGFPPLHASDLLKPVGSFLKKRQSELILSERVCEVIPNSAGKGFTVFTKHEQFSIGTVVLAVQHQDVSRLLPVTWQGSPVLTALSNLPTRPIVDVFLNYDAVVTNEPLMAVPGLPALWVISHSVPEGQQLAVSISCPGNLIDQPATQIVLWVQNCLAQALGKPMPGKLISSRVVKHMKATFSAAPEHQSLRPDVCTPIPGLLLAGDYTNTGWPATMESAVRSGYNTAKAILANGL